MLRCDAQKRDGDGARLRCDVADVTKRCFSKMEHRPITSKHRLHRFSASHRNIAASPSRTAQKVTVLLGQKNAQWNLRHANSAVALTRQC